MTGPKDTAFLFRLWVRRGKASSMQASWPRKQLRAERRAVAPNSEERRVVLDKAHTVEHHRYE